MTNKTIAIASDHAGFKLKENIISYLGDGGFLALDLGCKSEQSVDYPDYAGKMSQALQEGQAECGILICGSGIGISIAANRFSHIRAALCHNTTEARLSRLHNNANVLALGARMIGSQVAQDCVQVFLATEFEGGRHSGRVDKLSNM